MEMKSIKFVEAWAMYKPGERGRVFENIAKNLIAKGIAIDPAAPDPEPEAPPMAAEPKAVKKAVKPRRRWSK